MIFYAGDTAFILENFMRVKSVKILNRLGDMYTVRIGSGAICVRHTRLFATEEEAEKHAVKLAELNEPDKTVSEIGTGPEVYNVPRHETGSRRDIVFEVDEKSSSYRSLYDYWHGLLCCLRLLIVPFTKFADNNIFTGV